jgi:hypothetical protein
MGGPRPGRTVTGNNSRIGDGLSTHHDDESISAATGRRPAPTHSVQIGLANLWQAAVAGPPGLQQAGHVPGLSWWLVWSPPPESNRRPHPYHGTTRNRCANRRSPRSRPTVGAEVIGSPSAKVCVLLQATNNRRWRKPSSPLANPSSAYLPDIEHIPPQSGTRMSRPPLDGAGRCNLPGMTKAPMATEPSGPAVTHAPGPREAALGWRCRHSR